MDRCHQAITVLVLSGSTAIHWAYVSLTQSVPATCVKSFIQTAKTATIGSILLLARDVAGQKTTI